MNSLTWFLYFADVLSSMSSVFIGFGVLSSLVGVFGWIAWTVSKGLRADALGREAAKEIKEMDQWIELWTPLRKFLVVGFFLIVTAALLPAQKTMYAMAASEMGEQIIKNEAVQGVASDATKALQSWIKKQIEPETPAKK